MEKPPERKFLHDIASPISSANLLLATLIKRMEKSGCDDEMLKEGILELQEIVNELRLHLDKRRDIISTES